MPHDFKGEKYWTDERVALLLEKYPRGGSVVCLPLFPGRSASALQQAYHRFRPRGSETPRATVRTSSPKDGTPPRKRTAADIIAERIARAEDQAKALRQKRQELLDRAREREEQREKAALERRLPSLRARHEKALARADEILGQCREIDPNYGAPAATGAVTTLAGVEGIRAAQGQPFSEATMRVLRAGSDDAPPPVPDCVTHGDLLHIKKRVDHVLPAMVAQLRRELRVDGRSVVVAVLWCLRKMLVSRDESTVAFLDGRK